MEKIKKMLTWQYMFTKRLFHKYSFILILLIIPVSVFALSTVSGQDAGVMKVALCCDGECDAVTNEIFSSLVSGDSIIKYKTYPSPEEALEAVKGQKADVAWIFEENFQEKLAKYASDEFSGKLVEVVATEDTIPVKLSNEALFASFFKYFSYEMYKDFVYSEVVTENVSEDVIKEYYNKFITDESIVEVKKINSGDALPQANYIVAPVRGFLAVLIMLCGLAAALYFLSDMARGKYDWLPQTKRLLPAFASCFSAVLVASAVVFVTLLAAGMTGFILREIICIITFILAATAFCLLICTVFRSAGKLGALIPFIIILMLVFSPVFFSINKFYPVHLLFPTYYYLNSVTNLSFAGYAVIYSAVMYLLAGGLNIFLNRKERKVFI